MTEPRRLCKQCRNPIEEADDPRYIRCKACRAWRSRRDRLRKAAGKPIEPRVTTTSSDPEPAICLRRELDQHRADGMQFDDAWNMALRTALATLSPSGRSEWANVLWGTREQWRAAFDRTGAGPMSRMGDLADDPTERSYFLLVG
jgi:hypothetical protein